MEDQKWLICIAPESLNTIVIRTIGSRLFNGLSVDLLAQFCNKVYDIDPLDKPQYGHTHPSWTHPFGWIVDRVFYSYESGFLAALYTNEDAEYVLAFRGSDPDDADIDADVLQGFGIPTSQYEWAMRIARDVIEEHLSYKNRKSLTFTGHSLGGGLASMASIFTGVVPALTFNAAGLHELTRLWALKNRPIKPYDSRSVCAFWTPPGHIEAYHVDGEILTRAQKKFAPMVPLAVGTEVVIPVVDQGTSALKRHMMEVVIESLKTLGR